MNNSPKKIARYIEIVASSNPRLNAMVKRTRLAIYAVLSERYTNVAITIVDDMAGLERLVAKKPDLVILGMKLVLLDASKGYDDSPKMWLSTYLKECGINFTGSETDALDLELDKHDAKQRVIDAGLQSSQYFIAKIDNPNFSHDLKFPLFVKPANRGSSEGVNEDSVVYTQTELELKIRSIHVDYSSDALIEEYLPGREFSVAVVALPNSHSLRAMPIELIIPVDTRGNSFLSAAVKHIDSERVLAVDDLVLKHSLNSLAISVFQALGARDYGRVDMRLDASGNPSFIEANLTPGLSDHGYFSRCFSINEQIDYKDMILSVAGLGLERAAK